MKLETMTESDVELRIREETDPRMMADLGGARAADDIARAHARSLVLAADGECWPLKVIPDGSTSPAGGVAIFPSSHDGEAIYEIGWMVLPEFQNRGIATEAVGAVLEKARSERKFGRLHAFPATTNGSSNRICEKNGFTRLGTCEIEFGGRSLVCNHWRVDLF
jgi:RimJ/RimL family protein N-acetyltransferase